MYDCPVSVCVHLVDLVHHSEGAAVELLQSHEVQHGGHAALSSALMVRRQLMQLRATAKLHSDTDAILIILLLKHILQSQLLAYKIQPQNNLLHCSLDEPGKAKPPVQVILY